MRLVGNDDPAAGWESCWCRGCGVLVEVMLWFAFWGMICISGMSVWYGFDIKNWLLKAGAEKLSGHDPVVCDIVDMDK